MNTSSRTLPVFSSFLRKAVLSTALGLTAMFGAGCDEQGEQGEQAIVDDAVEDESEVSPRSYSDWTSEEYAPAVCSPASSPLVATIQCDGSNCDNVWLGCETISDNYGNTETLTVGTSTWSSWFSEEGAASNLNSRKCSGNTWMTGIKCSGSYCDELSIRCSAISGSGGYAKVPSSCAWSAWYSEEDFFFGDVGPAKTHFIRGVKCQGQYCDQMSYYVCLIS